MEDDFIIRAGSHSIGAKVKMADLKDNLDLTRIANPGEKDFERLAKYHRAVKIMKRRRET